MADRFNKSFREEKVMSDVRSTIGCEISTEMIHEVIRELDKYYTGRNGGRYIAVVIGYINGVGFNEYAKLNGIHPTTARNRYQSGISMIGEAIKKHS